MGPSSLRRGDMSQESLRRTRFATFCVGNPRPPGPPSLGTHPCASHPTLPAAACRRATISFRWDVGGKQLFTTKIVHTTQPQGAFLVTYGPTSLRVVGLVRSALLTFCPRLFLLRPNPTTPVPLRRFGVPALKGGRLCAASARVLLTIGAQGRRTHTASCCATFFKQ